MWLGKGKEGVAMQRATNTFMFILITLVLVVIAIFYICFMKGYWYYGSYTWEHSNIKRYTEADYKKSAEFARLFNSGDNESEKHKKLINLIHSGLEVNCPATSYNIESMETDYVDLPLTMALDRGNFEIANLLIEKGAIVGRIEGVPSPLHTALNFYDENNLEKVKFLLKNGAGKEVADKGTYYTNLASSLSQIGANTLANREDAHQVTLIFKELVALVNKEFSLSSSYKPKDLMKPDVAFSFGDQDVEKSLIRQEAGQALEQMFRSAAEENIELYAISGYRSYTRQKSLFDTEVRKSGEKKAAQAVAIPGQSEHQTGLTMDIASKSTNMNLTEDFGETPEGKWLAENAHKYGFILRYPKGKESITGYQYEPWHFRYVGVEAATTIFENEWTLEEFFKEVEKI